MSARIVAGFLGCAAALGSWAVHAEVRNPRGVAVIVGNGDYEHRDVPAVAYASRDAAAFARYVTDVLGFDPENVIHVADATRRRMFDVLGTKSEPRGELWSYLDPDGGSEVVVFYSGHGVPGQRDGRGYLLPVDADPKAAEDDGYPIDLLYENLGRLEEASSVRVYLDACFSGGSHKGGLIGSASPVFVKAALPEGLSGKVTALAAASGKQIASWDEKARHGLFTNHLLDALYGKGDADGDGKVTGEEARAYLDRHMTRAARRQHRRVQRASLVGSDGAVLSSAPAGGFPARPAPDSPPSRKILPRKATLTALKDVIARAGPGKEYGEAGRFRRGADIAVTGAVETEDGRRWLRVDLAGAAAFVASEALGPEPPSGPMAAEPRLGYEDRKAVQRGLVALGAAAGPSDGIFGRRTREALRGWQEGRGVEATGYLTRGQADALIAAGRKARGNAERERSAPPKKAAAPPDPAPKKAAAPPDPAPKKAAAPPKLTPVNKIMVAKRRTALRRSPDLMAGLAGYVESGEKIDVLARTKGWYQVGMELEIAYASTDSLRDLQCRMVDRMKKVRRTVDEGRYIYGSSLLSSDRETCVKSATRNFRRDLSRFARNCKEKGGALENVPEIPQVLSVSKYGVLESWRCSINYRADLEEAGKEPVVPLCVVYDSVRAGEDEVCE